MRAASLRLASRKVVILLAVILPLVGTAYAVVLLWNRLVTWRDLALLAGMYFATGFGVTIGYHRMLTHRSFDAPAPVRGFFLALGSMSLQGPAIDWAATHLKHHSRADDEGDPHSPLHGFFHAHMGWLFGYAWDAEPEWRRGFEKDRVVSFIDRTFFLWATLGFLIPFALGGWTGLLWGGLVRVFLGHHITWSVNSICHTFGRKTYKTTDESRNQWVVGLLAMGEGWHNNHHAFPRSAYHGLRWWQFDASAYVIWFMAKLRLARNVWRPKADELKARARKTAEAIEETADAISAAASPPPPASDQGRA